MYGDITDKNNRRIAAENDERVPNMPKLSGLNAEKTKLISLSDILTGLEKPVRENLSSGFDLKRFAKIFEDENMMLTITAFLENGMNVSLTARKLYMHRNTLIYRLNSVYKKTGLDIRNFDMAVTFCILHYLYILK